MEKKFTSVIVDNGYFAKAIQLEEPQTAKELEALFCGKQEACTDDTIRIITKLDDTTRKNMEFFLDEMEKAKYITQRPKAYEQKTFTEYCLLRDRLYVTHQWGRLAERQLIQPEQMPLVQELKRLRESLIQTGDPEEGIWYIWEHDMPVEDKACEYDWRCAYDSPDYRPFIIPYMLDDQENIKGNIVVVSGGAGDWRSNVWEGYATVKKFNEKGYNCFLLQRRVAPYDKLDAGIDLQRAIRYIRHHADRYGITHTDRMAVCGFSGGGNTIGQMLAYCYADVTPDVHRPSYVPDETDRENSAVSAALLIYGMNERMVKGAADEFLNNPDLPAIFMVTGQDDFAHMDMGSTAFYSLVRDKVPAEVHVLAGTVHGFGAGCCAIHTDADNYYYGKVLNTLIWPSLADTFMMQLYGLMGKYEKI